MGLTAQKARNIHSYLLYILLKSLIYNILSYHAFGEMSAIMGVNFKMPALSIRKLRANIAVNKKSNFAVKLKIATFL
ncbi:MAG TPA: hypothetical protein DDW28_10900 [Prevotella sp.]|nr:hypothetical protein [Candidatus Segatella violae]